VKKINTHCRTELDPLYKTMRILEAEGKDLESAFGWFLCAVEGPRSRPEDLMEGEGAAEQVP